MAFLADLERLLERVFERSSARLFRTHLQAVQLERRVERAMEHARHPEDGRTTVPSRYRVRLAPPDLAAAAEQEGSAEALAGRLADASLAFARAHGYHLRGRPTVSLLADPSIVAGQVEVDAVIDPAPHPPGRSPGPRPAAPPPVDPAPHAPAVASARSPAEPVAPSSFLAYDEAPPGIRGDGTHTLVFRRPAAQAPRACLRAFAPDGTERTIEVGGAQLTIGRASDNGIVLADGRVSRHHGRLMARHGVLVYTDLGSTNGTRVNGVRVDEIVLGVGDRLLLGDTVLVVETLPG